MDKNSEEKNEDMSSSSNEYYSKKDFWNERFQKTEGFFDWYVGWNELKSIVMKYINSKSEILMVGCGNSKLSESMYNSDFKNISNIDISDVVINKMNDMYKEKFPEMKFKEMDATNMTYADNSFDLVFDKGTLDALMCDKHMVAPFKLVNEMYRYQNDKFRVTKVNGQFIIVTYGDPSLRLKFLTECINSTNEENVKIDIEKIELSLLSNLINSLRNRSQDGNMSSAIKDNTILLNSLIDVYDSKISDKDLDKVTRKKYLSMKLVALMKLSKIEKQKKLEKLAKEIKEETSNAEKNNTDNSGTDSNKISDNITQDTINLIDASIEKVDLNDKSKNNDVQEKMNSTQNKSDRRRTHCYAYIFSKIK